TIYVRAGRSSGPWVLTTLEFRSATGAIVNLMERPAAAITPAPRGPVYLVHLGETRKVSVESLREYYRVHLGLEVTVLTPAPVDPSAFNTSLHQFEAKGVVESMKRSFPRFVANQDATIIGILEDDMYAFDWNHAFSYREEGRFGVV